jgi:hypothetical protein
MITFKKISLLSFCCLSLSVLASDPECRQLGTVVPDNTQTIGLIDPVVEIVNVPKDMAHVIFADDEASTVECHKDIMPHIRFDNDNGKLTHTFLIPVSQQRDIRRLLPCIIHAKTNQSKKEMLVNKNARVTLKNTDLKTIFNVGGTLDGVIASDDVLVTGFGGSHTDLSSDVRAPKKINLRAMSGAKMTYTNNTDQPNDHVAVDVRKDGSIKLEKLNTDLFEAKSTEGSIYVNGFARKKKLALDNATYVASRLICDEAELDLYKAKVNAINAKKISGRVAGYTIGDYAKDADVSALTISDSPFFTKS